MAPMGMGIEIDIGDACEAVAWHLGLCPPSRHLRLSLCLRSAANRNGYQRTFLSSRGPGAGCMHSEDPNKGTLRPSSRAQYRP